MEITQVAVNGLRVPVDRPYVAGGRTVDANWHVVDQVTTSAPPPEGATISAVPAFDGEAEGLAGSAKMQ